MSKLTYKEACYAMQAGVALDENLGDKGRTVAMNEAAAMVDAWNIGLSKQDLLLAEEIRKLGGAR